LLLRVRLPLLLLGIGLLWVALLLLRISLLGVALLLLGIALLRIALLGIALDSWLSIAVVVTTVVGVTVGALIAGIRVITGRAAIVIVGITATVDIWVTVVSAVIRPIATPVITAAVITSVPVTTTVIPVSVVIVSAHDPHTEAHERVAGA